MDLTIWARSTSSSKMLIQSETTQLLSSLISMPLLILLILSLLTFKTSLKKWLIKSLRPQTMERHALKKLLILQANKFVYNSQAPQEIPVSHQTIHQPQPQYKILQFQFWIKLKTKVINRLFKSAGRLLRLIFIQILILSALNLRILLLISQKLKLRRTPLLMLSIRLLVKLPL